MDKLIVRGTEVSIQWNMERDDYISLTDIANVKGNQRKSERRYIAGIKVFPMPKRSYSKKVSLIRRIGLS